MAQTYDVIIVGASFAGLAVARELKGRVLIIDRKPIGSGQTSACGTLLEVAKQLGAMDAVLQAYDMGYIHTPIRTITYQLPYAFCTLDYQRFCATLSERADFSFVQGSVLGLEGRQLVTTQGVYEGRILVDASGWRAALGSQLDPNLVDRRGLSFGLEYEVPRRGDGLYFWVDPALIQRGVGWDFPCGDTSRVGVGSYARQTALSSRLNAFTEGLGPRVGSQHGGFFTSGLRRGRAGDVFLVGDAVGQCLPLTGEGIRPALYFGQQCGRLIQQVLDGEVTQEQALKAYADLVDRFRPTYRVLKLLESTLSRLPPAGIQPIFEALSTSWLCRGILLLYRATTPGRYTLSQSEKLARRKNHATAH